MEKRTNYESVLRMVDLNTLEYRRKIVFFKCFKENGPILEVEG